MAQAKESPSSCAGSTANLIENNQATFGGLVEDCCGFGHLDHKGRASGMELIRSSDAGKDPVDQANGGTVRRYEATDMGHECNQGNLSDIGALACHVGSGDQEQ